MYNTREIAPQVSWIGAGDRRLERFENMFPLPNGVEYNSYIIMDEKTVLLDTADSSVSQQYMENVEHALNGRTLDYIIINHMEPDHCANIEMIIRQYPEVKVVGNKKTFQLFQQFYNMNIEKNKFEVSEGEELELGKHTLKFYFAPMVHWPEVMVTYEKSQGILFSADAFGSFGALPGNLYADEVDFENGYLDETRRYYANIVGKYGKPVQALLKKLSGVDIKLICPLHGFIWRENIPYLIDKYNKWSLYEPEKSGVVLFYASMYGNTANAVNVLANKLSQRGIKDMRIYDVSKTHPSYIISDIWKYSHMVIASPTYNLKLYYAMDNLLREMSALGIKNRKAALIGCHSWASAALKEMTSLTETMKNIEILGESLDIKSSLKEEREPEIDELADTIANSVLGK